MSFITALSSNIEVRVLSVLLTKTESWSVGLINLRESTLPPSRSLSAMIPRYSTHNRPS